VVLHAGAAVAFDLDRLDGAREGGLDWLVHGDDAMVITLATVPTG
jgi:hypothetical protein